MESELKDQSNSRSKPAWLKGIVADVHPSVTIGEGSYVWSFAVVCEGVIIGNNSVIGSGVYVGRNCKIGNNVRVQDKAHLTDNMTIEDNVFIGPCAVTMNDKHPVANNPSYIACPPYLETYSSIGAGAVILPGVRVGRGSMVGAGAVVTKDVAPLTLVVGCPATHKEDLKCPHKWEERSRGCCKKWTCIICEKLWMSEGSPNA